MDFPRIFRQLRPGPETDRGFRDFLARLSGAGLQTIATVEMCVPLLLFFGRFAAEPHGGNTTARLWPSAAAALMGAITLILSRHPWSRRHPRLLAGISICSASFLITWSTRWTVAPAVGTDDYMLAAIALVVITGVALVPFRPLHTLIVGLSVVTMYFLSYWVGARWEFSATPEYGPAHYIFLFILVLLATGIAAENYEHRQAEFDALQQAVRVAEALAGAQLRAQLAENAISIGKMAAALSHEINTPLGTLRSSIDTLLALTDRQVDAPPQKRDLLAKMRAELCRSIDESAVRIDDVMVRLRRFVNLEEADLKTADINELLADVAQLYRDRIEERRIRLEFELEKPLPRLTCRPQLLSAVFSSLLSNAINAVNGDRRIGISTHHENASLEITIRDNGKGMTPDEADNIFDPSFKIAGNRVSSGNWSLFNTRQIVYEHGGDIRVDTAAGKGTTVQVSLPLAQA